MMALCLKNYQKSLNYSSLFTYAVIPVKRSALKKAYIFFLQFWMNILMLSKLHDS